MKANWELPIIQLEYCTKCGVCVNKCPEHVLSMGNSGPLFLHPQKCNYCAICEDICPERAIRCELEIIWEIPSKRNLPS